MTDMRSDRDGGCSWRKRLGLGGAKCWTPIFLIILSGSVSGGEPSPSASFGENLADPKAIVERLPEIPGDPQAGARAQLLVLAEIRGTLSEKKFYEACLDKMAKNAGRKETAALEALLNSEQYWAHPKSRTGDLIMALRPKASKLWYDLIWADADEKTKIRTALYGFQPAPPVRPSHRECFDRMKQVGKTGRDEFYKTLTRRYTKLEYDAWTLASVSCAIDLLREADFAPGKAELKALLDSSSVFGRMIGVGYAARVSASDFPAEFNSLIEENLSDARALYHIGYDARFAKKLDPEGHSRLVQTIVKMGRQAQKQITEPEGVRPNAMWFGVVYRANMLLDEIGPGPEGEAYLRDCQEFHQKLSMKFLHESSERYQAEVTSFLDEAASRAKSALSKSE
jgi:hypothetical protein